MSMTIQRPAAEDHELILDLVEGYVGGPTVDDWLATIWGIQAGKSSPLSQPALADRAPGIASWLHLWGLAPLPLT